MLKITHGLGRKAFQTVFSQPNQFVHFWTLKVNCNILVLFGRGRENFIRKWPPCGPQLDGRFTHANDEGVSSVEEPQAPRCSQFELQLPAAVLCVVVDFCWLKINILLEKTTDFTLVTHFRIGTTGLPILRKRFSLPRTRRLGKTGQHHRLAAQNSNVSYCIVPRSFAQFEIIAECWSALPEDLNATVMKKCSSTPDLPPIPERSSVWVECVLAEKVGPLWLLRH